LPHAVKHYDNAQIVLSMLYNYGYLTYNFATKSFRIPNEELKLEFARINSKLCGIPENLKIFYHLLEGNMKEFE